MLAADTGAAMLYGKGTVSLNGGQVPGSSAIFPGDSVHTNGDSTANINFTGSSAVMLGDSSAKLEDNSFSLSRGTIAVITSIRTSTHVCEVRITPVSDVHTEYEVRYSGDKVEITARKGDVTVQSRGRTDTLPEGNQTRREDPCKAAANHRGGAFPAAVGPSNYLIYGGAGVVAGLTTWVILQGDDPVSPSVPRKKP